MNKYTLKEPFMIGKYIKIQRENMGISSKTLANMLDVTPAAVSGWESGSKAPDIFKSAILAQIFGVSIDQFFSCDLSQNTDFKGEKLSDYLREKNKSNITINNISSKSKHKILSDLINCISVYKKYLVNLLEENSIDMDKFNYLSNLLGVNIKEQIVGNKKDREKVIDSIEFNVINEFLMVLYEDEFDAYLNELLEISNTKTKTYIVEHYLNNCRNKVLMPKTKVLYYFVIHELIDNKKMISKICKALYNKEKTLIYNFESQEDSFDRISIKLL